MCPQEILCKVEEAAGTCMFKDHKDKAKKAMSKKDKRVQELRSILAEEITAKLDNPSAEMQQFLALQKEHAELERIGRILGVYKWTVATRSVQTVDDEIGQKKGEHTRLEKSKKKPLRDLKLAMKEHEDVKARCEAELQKGGKLKKLEEEVAKLERE